MREIRSSGSVEGVISDGHSYSDSTSSLQCIGLTRHARSGGRSEGVQSAQPFRQMIPTGES